MVLTGKDGHEVTYMTEAAVDLDGNVLLTVQETVDLLRIGRHTLMDWMAERWGPPCVDLAPPGRKKRTLRYARVDVLQFIQAQKLWEAAA
jgi:hypothetical protein